MTAPTTRIAPLDLDAPGTVERLHAWVSHPRSVFWQMGDLDPAGVRTAHEQLLADEHHDVWLGHLDGEPMFLVETYHPARSAASEVADRPELARGDLGMHVLVAPPADGEPPVPGLTRVVFAAAMRHCFEQQVDGEPVRRVVVEPDARNERIAVLNSEAGFEVVARVALASKTAALSVCPRAAWRRSPLAALEAPA